MFFELLAPWANPVCVESRGPLRGSEVGPGGRNTREALAEWLKPLAMTERPRGESHIAAWPEGPPLATTGRPRGERRIAALLESPRSELHGCKALPVGAHMILRNIHGLNVYKGERLRVGLL